MRIFTTITLFLIGATPGFSQSKSFVPGEIIIRFEKGSIDSTFMFGNERKTLNPRQIIRSNKVDSILLTESIVELRKVMRPLPEAARNTFRQTKNDQLLLDISSIMVLRVSEQTDILSLCEKLSKVRGISYAEPNWISTVNNTTPNDTGFGAQHSFYSTDASFVDGHINATRAWDFTTGSSSIRVGVLDTGIDYHHEDLGNGAYGTSNAIVAGGYNYINSNLPDDDDARGNNLGSHGTRVAGIIGAKRNNTLGVAGLGGGTRATIPGVKLYAFKIANSLGSSTDANMAQAIVESTVPYYGYACQIINLSSSGPAYNEVVRDAIRLANQAGALVVISKGNTGSSNAMYPADYDKEWVMAVGANAGDGTRLPASSYGGGIDVVAPGFSGMISTTTRVEENSTSPYGSFANTSAAAPHVAGLAALIKSVKPDLHQNDVEGLIKSSATDITREGMITGLIGYDIYTGYGKIDAGRALEMTQAPWQLTQHTWTGGSIYSSTGMYVMNFKNNGGGPLNGLYKVIKHAVRISPGTGLYQNNEFYAWGRNVNAATGWSDAATNYQLGFTEVLSKGTQSVALQTYVYQVYTNTSNPVYLGWYPTSPGNVVFAYSLLGKPEFNVSIDGPDLLGQGQVGNWTAAPINCSNPTQYRWYKKLTSASFWTDTGNTTNAYSTTITANTNLRCDITCGGETKSGYKNLFYDNGQLLLAADPVPEVTAHPNPVGEEVSLTGELSGSTRIAIYDQLGRTVAEKIVTGNSTAKESFSTSQWQTGFYIVKISYANGTTTHLKLYKAQ